MPQRTAHSNALLRSQFFHAAMFGYELENVLAGNFSKFGAEINIVAEIVDSSDQVFQNK